MQIVVLRWLLYSSDGADDCGDCVVIKWLQFLVLNVDANIIGAWNCNDDAENVDGNVVRWLQ